MPGPLTDALAWVVIGLFGVGAVCEYLARRRGLDPGGLAAAFGADRLELTGRALVTAAWVAFAGFWLVLFPHFAFVHKSYVEGALALAAVPACLYAGWLLWNGRDSLFVLSRAVGVMGAVYLPFETIPALTVAGLSLPAPRRLLIETVAAQTGFLMGLLGYHPELMRGPQGFLNMYQFVADDGHILRFYVVLACTGLGSMAIFAGLIAAVRAPLRRKARALAVAIPLIWGLNLLRTTFIGIVFGTQKLQVAEGFVLFLFGATDPYRVSFFLSDRVISQLLAVVALVGITYLVVRELPELLTVIEDVLYMLTKEEHDLAAALDLPRPRTDGGEADQPE